MIENIISHVTILKTILGSQISLLMKQQFRGQTLIEVLIAFGILGIVISAIGGAITSSLNNVQAAKNKTFATKYAQEGLEAIRELRNKNYTQFRSYSGDYCLGTIPAELNQRPSSCATPNVNTFIRTTTIDQSGCGLNIASVAVKVAWNDAQCAANNYYCNSVTHNSCLSTVNPIQAP